MLKIEDSRDVTTPQVWRDLRATLTSRESPRSLRSEDDRGGFLYLPHGIFHARHFGAGLGFYPQRPAPCPDLTLAIPARIFLAEGMGRSKIRGVPGAACNRASQASNPTGTRC